MSELRIQRGVKRGKFTRKESALRAALTAQKPIELVEALWKEVCDAFTEVEELNEQMHVKAGKKEEEEEECIEYISRIEEIKLGSINCIYKDVV